MKKINDALLRKGQITMRQIPSDKYSIAWFKLAECVARGEKERALGVYRLLSHSIIDQAFVNQLAGDLLWAFDDESAEKEYQQAAQLYHKRGRLLEAAAVYENLLTLVPKKELYLNKLVQLYVDLDRTTLAAEHLQTLLDIKLADKQLEQAHKIIKRLEPLLTPLQAAKAHKKVALAFLDDEDSPQERIFEHVTAAIDLLLSSNNESKLQRFLAQLQARNEWYYNQAISYLKKE